MEYHSAIRKYEVMLFVAMDGPRGYHSEWSKSERRRNSIWYHLYLESKKWYKWTYLQNRELQM